MAKWHGDVLLDLARADERIFGVSCECWGFVAALAKEFPRRAIEVGIAEQNLIGVSAGLAVRGKIPFAHGMAPFVTMRCFEQIRDDVAYGKRNVKIIAAYSGGISMAEQGITHHAIEDVALMRMIPGMTVIMPSDAPETEKAVRAAAVHEGPVYISLGGGSHASTDESRPFEIGRAVTLRDGDDLTIIATGPTVREALRAADLFAQEGCAARVINMHTVKPLDVEAVCKAACETAVVMTLEEHTVLGGLGGAVAEAVAEAGVGTPVKRFGLQDTFAWLVGPYDEIRKRYGITAEAMLEFYRGRA